MRREENLGRSKTTSRVSFASPVKNFHGRSKSNRRESRRSSPNSRKEHGRSSPSSKREPGTSTSKGRREPNEPGRSRSSARLRESRRGVVIPSSRYLCHLKQPINLCPLGAGLEPDPCFSKILARTTFVLVILARGQKSL